jgi:hypothetical protein
MKTPLAPLFVSLLFFSSFFCSCRKTDNSHCMEEYYEAAYYPGNFEYPVFNPLNKNEIAFSEDEETRQKYHIYNTATNSSSSFIIQHLWYNGWQRAPYQKFSWGTNNTLLVSFPEDAGLVNITINPDGTGVDTLNRMYGRNLVRSPDCNRLLYYDWILPNNHLKIAELNAVAIDSVPIVKPNDFDWGANELIAVAYNNKFLGIYDTSLNLQKSLRLIADDQHYNFVFSLKWLPGTQKVMWSCFTGIYITDLTTEQTALLRPAGSDEVYSGLSVSDDGSQLVTTKMKWVCEDPDLGEFTKLSIHLIDLTTGSERELSIP